MKRTLLFTVLTVIAFVGSFFLASHFSHKSIDLPHQVTQSMRWFESLFLGVQATEIRPKESLESKTATLEPSIQLSDDADKVPSHVEVGNQPVCIDPIFRTQLQVLIVVF